MSRYGYLQAFTNCFYSKDFYRDIVQNWQVGVLLHLLFMLMMSSLVFALVIQKNVNEVCAGLSQQFFPQLPDMNIQSGKLKTPEKKPYLVKDSHNVVIAIIDTSGKYTNLNDSPVDFLLTENTLFYKSHNRIKAHAFDGQLDLNLHRDHIQQITGTVVRWLWLIMVPFLIIFSFAFRLIQIAIYSIIGKIFALLCKTSLTYGEIFKITVLAITPAIILDIIFNYFSITFHELTLLNFLITMGYVIFGIYANKTIAKG